MKHKNFVVTRLLQNLIAASENSISEGTGKEEIVVAMEFVDEDVDN
ncbi:3651_t:CDS:2 [Entrophospora sp. SA101]|nr:3651_t:CDS:2 [Entrophospora sp. SA101]